MYLVRLLHNIYFHMLSGKLRIDWCESLPMSVDLVVADMQFNIRRIRDYKNFKLYILASAGVKEVSNLCREKLQPAEPDHIFCNGLQSGLGSKVASRKVQCWKGLVGLVLILIEKKKGRKPLYLKWNWFPFITPVVLVLTIVPLKLALHSLQELL